MDKTTVPEAHRSVSIRRTILALEASRNAADIIRALLLAINDIHLRALAARHGGDDGSIILEIEQIAEDIINRACNEGECDTEFNTDE